MDPTIVPGPEDHRFVWRHIRQAALSSAECASQPRMTKKTMIDHKL
jgi:hypothetical protein